MKLISPSMVFGEIEGVYGQLLLRTPAILLRCGKLDILFIVFLSDFSLDPVFDLTRFILMS